MIQLDIDGPDVVLEAGAVFGGDTAEGDKERADQGGQPHPRVPSLEVRLTRNFFVEVDGAKSSRCAHHGECIQYPKI